MTWEAAFVRVLWCIFVTSHLVMSYRVIEGVEPEVLAGDKCLFYTCVLVFGYTPVSINPQSSWQGPGDRTCKTPDSLQLFGCKWKEGSANRDTSSFPGAAQSADTDGQALGAVVALAAHRASV